MTWPAFTTVPSLVSTVRTVPRTTLPISTRAGVITRPVETTVWTRSPRPTSTARTLAPRSARAPKNATAATASRIGMRRAGRGSLRIIVPLGPAGWAVLGRSGGDCTAWASLTPPGALPLRARDRMSPV
jgi:hypothetical protein